MITVCMYCDLGLGNMEEITNYHEGKYLHTAINSLLFKMYFLNHYPLPTFGVVTCCYVIKISRKLTI